MNSTTAIPPRSLSSVSPSAPAEAEAQPGSVFWRLGFVCWLGGVFILYSRFFDLVANGFRIPRIVLSLMVSFFLLSGRPLLFWRSTVGKIMVGMVFWVSFTLVFSVWKTGSVHDYSSLLQSALIFTIAAGLPMTVGNVRTSMHALALSGLTAALMAIPWGVPSFGRFALSQGSYADPNYYAMALVVTLPFFWEIAASTKSPIFKIFMWPLTIPLYWALAKTGSRGAMLGFAVMLLVLLVLSSMKTRIMIVALAVVGSVAIIAVMPSYIRARYMTFFEVDSKDLQQSDTVSSGNGLSDLERLEGDVGSAEGRKRLLLRSIEMTFEHPFVGVGPGNFPTAAFDESRASGHARNEWLVTHNSYTQISSETGITGLLFLVFLILFSFKNLFFVIKGSKPEGVKPDPAAYNAARYLLLSFTALCVCVFFLAVGYELTIYVWIGLTVSLRLSYEQQLAAAAVDVPEPQQDSKNEPLVEAAYARTRQELPERRPSTGSERRVRFNRFR